MPSKEKIPFGQSMVKPIDVQLSKLDLDLGNARFRADAEGQAAAMTLMLNSSGEKCMELLKDLCQQGSLNSSDVPIVVKDGDRYRVLEGNRRLTCLKLWKDPALLSQISMPLAEKYQKRIEKLAENSTFAPPSKMPVVVAKSVDEADIWIDKKHGLGKDGSATLEWGSFEKDRRAARRTGKVGRALSFVQFITDNFADDLVVMGTLDKVLSKQYSILDRVLSNVVLSDEIGIIFETSGLTTSKHSLETVRPLLLDMLSDFADKRQTAKTLHTVEQISDYLHDLYQKHLEGISFPTLKETSVDGTKVDKTNDNVIVDSSLSGGKSTKGSDTYFEQENTSSTNEEPSQTGGENAGAPPKASITKPQNKIFMDIDVDGFTPKIQRLINQTAALTVTRQPDLIAVSLRVILDLTCAQFLQKFHPNPTQIKRNLDDKIIAVLKILDPQCVNGVREAEKTSDFAKVFTWTSNNKNALRLVQYALHDVKHVNTPTETMIMAERYQEMLVSMNEKMRQNKSS